MYKEKVFVRFQNVDHAKKLFFAEAFQLAHECLENWTRQSEMLSWNTWFNYPEWAVPIVHCESNFSLPVFAGDELKVILQLIKTGTSSLTLGYNFIKDDHSAFSVATVHVFLDKKTLMKRPIPEQILLAVQKELT